MDAEVALLDAVKKGDLKSTSNLLSALRSDVNHPHIHVHAALVVAAAQGREDLCAVLLGEGADPTHAALDGYTALSAALARGHLRVLEQLIAIVATLPHEKQLVATALLHSAVEAGDCEAAELYLTAGYDPSARDSSGSSALHRAAFQGHMPAMQLLLEHGSSVDVANNDGMTPLHYTCLQGRTDAAQMLIALGADPSAVTRGGSPPLHAAATEGHVQLVTALLEAGAAVDAADMDGYTVRSAATGGSLHGLCVGGGECACLWGKGESREGRSVGEGQDLQCWEAFYVCQHTRAHTRACEHRSVNRSRMFYSTHA
jgi:ankyrin repeat protein